MWLSILFILSMWKLSMKGPGGSNAAYRQALDGKHFSKKQQIS
jgi:hypothetical protein